MSLHDFACQYLQDMLGTQRSRSRPRGARAGTEESWWAQLVALYQLIALHGAYELVSDIGPAVW